MLQIKNTRVVDPDVIYTEVYNVSKLRREIKIQNRSFTIMPKINNKKKAQIASEISNRIEL
jgi:hypothetical protein